MIWLAGIGIPFELIAQRDTVHLQEITIEALDPSRYLPGGMRWSLPADTLVGGNLWQRINEHLPFYFVQYGAPGQLASINLRGFGASRTSLVWEGLELNSFTLGQADYGEIWMSGGNQITVELGAVSALYGNGALGGTINVDHQPHFDGGHKVSLNQDLGIFGFHATQLGYDYSSSPLSWSTRLIYSRATNDFPYYENGARTRQRHAGFNAKGLFQDLYYRINEKHSLAWHFWYNDFDREVQPLRNDLQSEDKLRNNAARTLLDWTWSQGFLTANAKAGFTHDNQLYNNNDQVMLNRWFAAYEVEWSKISGVLFKTGLQANHLIARVDAYRQRIKETRPDLFFSAYWEPFPRIKGGFNLRAPMVNWQFKPLSPLISLQYILAERNQMRLGADIQAGRSFRLPTLNDRFWQPGGNPDLKPETSYSLETGLSLNVHKKLVEYQGQLRLFKHRVLNWIIWIPGGREEGPDGSLSSFWFPDNIREVSSTGIESYNSVTLNLPDKNWRSTLDANGAFLRAVNKKTISPLDRSLDKQLPYTPKWSFNGNWQLHYKNHTLGMLVQYRGPRYVETNNELPPLPGYQLWKLQLATRSSLGPVNWMVRGSINNLFNRSYENFENRAMPGRSYGLSVYVEY